MKQRIENETMWLTDAFARHLQGVPGSDIMQSFQREQLKKLIDRGLPSRQEEWWKYADLLFLEKTAFDWPAAVLPTDTARALAASRAENNVLIVLMNGQFVPQLSSQAILPDGVIVCSLQEALKRHMSLISPYLLRDIDVERHPLASLNNALFSDGLFIYLPATVALEAPVHVLSIAVGQRGFMMHPRHLIVMESDTHLTVSAEYAAIDGADEYLTNAVWDIVVGRHSLLNYYNIQHEAPLSKHFANVFLHQKQHSFVNACSFALGGQFARHELTAYLQEKHASCNFKGFSGLSRDGQCLDHHLFIDHAALHTQSEMDFHGVVAKQARAIFNGKVLVRQEAQKTEARQFNHHILLSPLAEVDTKPDLEIYADEVQCRHGATVGQLDEDALFYLGARGIPRREATMLLLQAFMEKALSSVTLPWVVQVMQKQWGAMAESFL